MMNSVDNKLMNESQTKAGKIFDFLIGFLGSLVVGNLGMIYIAQFDTPERLWIPYFTWFWRLALVGLAAFLFTRKKIWMPIGIVAAVILQSF